MRLSTADKKPRDSTGELRWLWLVIVGLVSMGVFWLATRNRETAPFDQKRVGGRASARHEQARRLDGSSSEPARTESIHPRPSTDEGYDAPEDQELQRLRASLQDAEAKIKRLESEVVVLREAHTEEVVAKYLRHPLVTTLPEEE